MGSGGIDIALFPERRGVELPGDEDAWHRLYFWLDEDGYKLKAGMALSSEILLDFGAGDPAVFDWLENPVLVRPDIDYVNSTGTLNPIGTRRDSLLPNYEELADIAIRSFYDDQQHYRAFGQVNFGDWYGESGWSWGNNEYDPAYVGYTEFLRGGDPSWAVWAADSARHLADVDKINFSGDPRPNWRTSDAYRRASWRLPAALLSQQNARRQRRTGPYVCRGTAAALSDDRRRIRI